MMSFDRTDAPRPSVPRRIWFPGLQYGGETDAQMLERERICREDDARADAECERLWRWKCRPWWQD